MSKLVWSARRGYCWTARAEDGTYIMEPCASRPIFAIN